MLSPLRAAGAPVRGLARSLDGNWLASAGDDKLVRVWSAGNGAPGPKPPFAGFAGPVDRVTFSGNNQFVIGAGTNGAEQFVFDLTSGESARWGYNELEPVPEGHNVAAGIASIASHDPGFSASALTSGIDPPAPIVTVSAPHAADQAARAAS